MINSWLIVTIWLCFSFLEGNPSHAIYLSLTDVEITEVVADFKVKVFSDDLRDALKNYRSSAYKPAGMDAFFSLNQEIAQDYFNTHFPLWSDGKPLALTIAGCTIEGDAHFIAFRCPIPKGFKEITLKADFFMELFPTQINVVKIKNGTQTKFLRFDMPVESQTANF